MHILFIVRLQGEHIHDELVPRCKWIMINCHVCFIRPKFTWRIYTAFYVLQPTFSIWRDRAWDSTYSVSLIIRQYVVIQYFCIHIRIIKYILWLRSFILSYQSKAWYFKYNGFNKNKCSAMRQVILLHNCIFIHIILKFHCLH